MTVRHLKHEQHKQQRHQRLNSGVYGTVHTPVIEPGDPVLHHTPSYTASRHTSNQIRFQIRDGVDRKLDMRCFYTGIELSAFPKDPPSGWNHDPQLQPWLGTRDHLVPARRAVEGQPRTFVNYASTQVWCSNLVNVTLGLTPLVVRLKLRCWLRTVRIRRDCPSLLDAQNLRWWLIHSLDSFRIQGRFPWSRNSQQQWWNRDISEPLMQRWWFMEQQFLALNEQQRDQWIQNFDWQF